jgi:hypothetical protein
MADNEISFDAFGNIMDPEKFFTTEPELVEEKELEDGAMVITYKREAEIFVPQKSPVIADNWGNTVRLKWGEAKLIEWSIYNSKTDFTQIKYTFAFGDNSQEVVGCKQELQGVAPYTTWGYTGGMIPGTGVLPLACSGVFSQLPVCGLGAGSGVIVGNPVSVPLYPIPQV